MEKGIKALKGKLIIKGILKLETGMHIGSSSDFAPIGAVDSPFIRDAITKQPIIPGSSLKGKIRTLLARSFSENYVLNDIKEDKEEIQRLFGTSDKQKLSASRLQFSDIKLTEESHGRLDKLDTDTYIGEIKWENTINRVTAVANPRQIERVPAGAEFNFTVIYNIEKEDEVTDDLKLLADGIRLLQLDYIGGHGSRGYGRVSFRDFSIDFFSISGKAQEEWDIISGDAQQIFDGI